MNLFTKLKELIRQLEPTHEYLSDPKSPGEVLLANRLETFSEKLTPALVEIGLKHWDGRYLWYSDFNEDGVKHVVEYNVFKQYGGSFSFGNCYQSVPTISGGKRLVNHKTDKSTVIHFFNRLPGWEKSLEDSSFNNKDRISTVSEAKFQTNLSDVMERNIPILNQWFKDSKSLDQNISKLKNEIQNASENSELRIVSKEYILSFLHKQKGDDKAAEYWINKHFEKELNSSLEKELLLNRLKKGAKQ